MVLPTLTIWGAVSVDQEDWELTLRVNFDLMPLALLQKQ